MLSSLLEPPMSDTDEPTTTFEIGVVYRSTAGRCYLAVDRCLLVTLIHDVTLEVEDPTGKFSVMRGMSVEKLCHEWQITLDRLDDMSAEYFAPTKSNRARRRLPDKFSNKEHLSQDMLNNIWARHRTHRVSGVD